MTKNSIYTPAVLLLETSGSNITATKFFYTTHTVAERGVTARPGQQQLDDLDVAVLAGAHERRRALVVLDVDVGAVSQQGSNHVHPAVTDRQHQPRLAGLRRGQKHGEQTRRFRPPRRRVRANINSELKRFH